MGRDKKALDGLTFVLDGPAGVEVVGGVDPTVARATLATVELTPLDPPKRAKFPALGWGWGGTVRAMGTVLLLHGPNLNLLGEREPAVYGTATLADHVATARAAADALGLDVEDLQSNHEGELVDAIHAARGRCAAIVINPGAFTHYAWACTTHCAAFDGPIVELHLSNPNAREPWRHTSVVAPVATGTIVGFGGHGYELAIRAVAAALGRFLTGSGRARRSAAA